MGLQVVPARLLAWEINAGTEAVPNWVAIGGLDGSAFPEPDVTELDTSDNDSAGVETSVPIAVKTKVTLEGQMLEDPATGARDAGQEACEAATPKAGNLGYDTIKQFRYTTPGSTVGTKHGWCKASSGKADRNGKIPWTCEINFND